MSDNAESIPHSPTPGKDPPISGPSNDASSPQPAAEETTDTFTKEKEKDTTTMRPPPRRISSSKARPKPQIITTQPSFSASRPSLASSRFNLQSTGHSYTLTQTQSQLSAQPEVQRPPFAPFFTLINDAGGDKEGHTIHPHKIHYIFSDDDTSDLLTSSLIHSLHPGTTSSSPSASRELSSSQRESSSSSSATFKTERREKKDRPKEKEKREREERVLIVDVDETGTGVKSVASLSSAWQVLSAEISNAPTFDAKAVEERDGGGERERGLMLRIQGVGVEVLGGEEVEERREGSGVVGEEEMSALLEGFDRKMGVLRRIVSSREELGGDGVEEGEENTVGTEAAGQGGPRRVSEEREFGSG
ncbi:hypothetical protein L207DRAFT_519355 [Hyaloscypha variabilis F]|uniref:Uncharacterized protein n=1 Tax=Hyaloscypha variabilis (strain UAMH 11265 / GT02V1 / F) TaxID=1149755 RepID=A0A2J6QZ96_HYAVF|nr:hypothetical protein L207DRAFT_519355 [Hyaloscypha variabilis F]